MSIPGRVAIMRDEFFEAEVHLQKGLAKEQEITETVTSP